MSFEEDCTCPPKEESEAEEPWGKLMSVSGDKARDHEVISAPGAVKDLGVIKTALKSGLLSAMPDPSLHSAIRELIVQFWDTREQFYKVRDFARVNSEYMVTISQRNAIRRLESLIIKDEEDGARDGDVGLERLKDDLKLATEDYKAFVVSSDWHRQVLAASEDEAHGILMDLEKDLNTKLQALLM